MQAKLDALRSAIVTGDIPQNINFAISLEVLADFLIKNRIAFRDRAISAPLDTARVAELAQSFTYRVECRSRSQQAGVSPSIKPNRPDPRPDADKDPQRAGASPSIAPVQLPLPPCPGSYTLTWTNCVGNFTFTDGRKYVGDFRDGKTNGEGTEYRADGSILRSGIWENGVFIRSR